MEASTTALLYLNGINVSFDGFRALNNLSLAVEPGEMRAIIGPNGAGKTTMMDVVTGKTRPGNAHARQRPQVSEAHGVRNAHRGGQSAAGAEERPPPARHHEVGQDSGRG